MEIKELTIKKFHEGLFSKDFSAVEATNAFFDYIEAKDKEIDAYLSIHKGQALANAKEVDSIIASGETLDVLAGTPLAIKDNILIEGLPATAGSKILKDYIASYDASVTNKLKQDRAIFLGKTNLDEFAMGSSTENSAYKITKNPHDLTRVPGGSSGGSAAAVASGMALGALGSDTGGSIRQPASFCGAVGLKPTYGAVSRYGLISMASSLDQIGTFAKISLVMEEAITELKNKGFKFKKITLPHTKYALSVYYIIMPAEVSTNLSRFDGIRYGAREKAKNLLDLYYENKGAGFGPESKRRIILGTFVLSAGYYDAYYAKAQKVRRLIKNDFDEAFKGVDVILTPVAPTPAFKIGEKTNNPLDMYLSDIFTIPVNLAGLPGISIPVKGREGRLPIGFQLIGKKWREADILGIGRVYEES
ncbi:MAG: aspartyl/glutamyl-tRNA amidotransferase subunit A [Candidatus Colwellbacteria bacterium]|nr:aspartyl/glutamyl-tRNA amidotransferase subunit A [Candidatus Colwellbacteria bacterium]